MYNSNGDYCEFLSFLDFRDIMLLNFYPFISDILFES